jgi:hypothetical protein
MQLIQILLPLYNKEGQPFEQPLYEKIKNELTDTFGGLTAYTRSPASGIWKKEDEKIVRDELYVYEVMVQEIDKDYWTSYKLELQREFKQEELIIRYSEITLF